jgi:hypothetical protein
MPHSIAWDEGVDTSMRTGIKRQAQWTSALIASEA